MNMLTNVKVYDLQEAVRASGYPMQEQLRIEEQFRPIDGHDWKRATALANRESSEGHDNFLSGIIVSFDLTCSIKMWTEFQRYHFAQIVSSQSTMHRLHKMELLSASSPYTDKAIIDRLIELQTQYNKEPTEYNKLCLLYSCPVGMQLTARVTTNYRQLKTMLKQRHNHALPEWKDFCREILERCPYARIWLDYKK